MSTFGWVQDDLYKGGALPSTRGKKSAHFKFWAVEIVPFTWHIWSRGREYPRARDQTSERGKSRGTFMSYNTPFSNIKWFKADHAPFSCQMSAVGTRRDLYESKSRSFRLNLVLTVNILNFPVKISSQRMHARASWMSSNQRFEDIQLAGLKTSNLMV